MADKVLNGNSLQFTSSLPDIICSKLHTMNHVNTRKRHVSEIKNEFDATDQPVLDDETCEKRTLHKEIESNTLFERTLKSLREEVHFLAKKIELIEDSLTMDNLTKDDNVTLIPDNDEVILYQPAKKKIKLEENMNCMIFHDSTNGSSDSTSKSINTPEKETYFKQCNELNTGIQSLKDSILKTYKTITENKKTGLSSDNLLYCTNYSIEHDDVILLSKENIDNAHNNNEKNMLDNDSRSFTSPKLLKSSSMSQINDSENTIHINDNLSKLLNTKDDETQSVKDEIAVHHPCENIINRGSCNSSVHMTTQTSCYRFFEVNQSPKGNSSLSLQAVQTKINNDLDCNDLKIPAESSHPIDNEIILENKNIDTVNEKNLVKDSRNLSGSSQAFHDVINLCDDKFHSNKDDVQWDKIVQNDFVKYSDTNNDMSILKNDFESSDLEKPTEMSRQVDNVIILEDENISTTNEKVFVKDSKKLRDSSGTVHDAIDLCDDNFCTNKADDSITLLDIISLDDDINYSIEKNDNNVCKKISKNLKSQNCFDSSIALHDVIDLCDEKYYSNKNNVLGSVTLLDEIILDDEISYSIKTNNSGVCKNLRNSINLTNQNLMGASNSTIHDEIDLCDEDFCSNKVDGNVTLMDKIILDNCIDYPTKNSDSSMCKKNYETLICNPVECNKSIKSFDDEIDTSSQNYVSPLNYDGGTIIDLNKSILSLSASEVDRILETSISISESSDVSILFMPSKKDFLKYEIDLPLEMENLEEGNQTEVEEELKQPSYDSINHLKCSDVAKDGEDNVTFFYDCDLSSIENSDNEEDNEDHETKLLKNCENPTLVNYSTSTTQYLSSSVHCDHKYHKVMARSPSNQQTQPDKFDVECYMVNPSIKANVFNCTDIHSESISCLNIKPMSNNTMPKCRSIHDINPIQSDQTNLNDDKIEIKSYKTETVEKPDANELSLDDSISPYISQSLAKSSISQNLENALAKKAAANIDVNAMGSNTLCTYLTQQTITLDVLRVLHKSLDTCPSSSILLDDPIGLVVPLMEHQKHAIAWLMWRESQEPRGGILADDMGLGKTLSMISLVLKSEENQNCVPVVSNDNNKNDFVNGGTLVVCPSSLLSQWENEVRTKVIPGRLNVGQYYGVNRSKSASELAKHDLVTTSYNVIMWDYKKQQNSSPLFQIKWKRIILDEAHNIRNPKSKTSIAVCNMTCINHWALTGTPIHNKEADFFTLLKFIGCKPFDDWPVWKQWVGNNDDADKHRLSLLVKTLMLRRTKKELSLFTTFNLPSKNIYTVEVELTKEERNAYIQLLQFSSRLFATYLFDRALKAKLVDSNIDEQCKIQYFQDQSQEKENVFKDHPELLKLFKKFNNIVEVQSYHILVLFLRLRQICCHPCLIKGIITEENVGDIIPKNENLLDNDASDDDNVSGVLCNNNTTNIAALILNDEIIDLSDLMNSLSLNNKEEPDEKMNTPIDSDDIFKKSWQSSKIKAVCDLVWEKVLKDDGREKAIIVSQWSSMLYLIRLHLSQYDVKMGMFIGSVPILKRNTIIREFNNTDSGPQILLLSLTAGGVGLNLMAANHMFMVDVHWNPQLEAQACDRIYRVGQTKPVNIYKFVCANTIETKIVMIQAHKLAIAQNLFEGGASVASSKITLDDLKTIFQVQD